MREGDHCVYMSIYIPVVYHMIHHDVKCSVHTFDESRDGHVIVIPIIMYDSAASADSAD